MSEKLEAASLEMDMVSDLFNRMVKSCHAKCVDRKYLDDTLNKGEGVCADRCGECNQFSPSQEGKGALHADAPPRMSLPVSKYFEANEIVGKQMQIQGQALQQQQQAQPEKKGWFS